MNNTNWLKIWQQELEDVVITYDIEAFKKFYQKWKARGFYKLKLPEDKVIAISLLKMVYNMKSSTEEQKAEAKEWLESRGLTTEM